MRAIAGEASIAAGALNLGAGPFGGPLFDNAGEIAARDARKSGLLHRAGDVLDVARIDRSRYDPHQCRPLVGRRRRRLHQLENRRGAEGLQAYRPHGWSFRARLFLATTGHQRLSLSPASTAANSPRADQSSSAHPRAIMATSWSCVTLAAGIGTARRSASAKARRTSFIASGAGKFGGP